MPLPALSSTQLPEAIPDWTPLDRKRVLEHFMLSRDYENIAEYISFQSVSCPTNASSSFSSMRCMPTPQKQ